LRAGNLTWLERIVSEIKSTLSEVVLLGGGAVPPSLRSLPRLPDVSDKDGPLAGMLAAMRWDPRACWVFLACDLPCVSRAAVEWLLRRRAPGVRAILPRLENSRAVEPLLALYESRSKLLLERCAAPSALAGFPGVVTPEPPGDIAAAWKSLNTPGELAAWHHADPAST
jgi:molybdopterin-guanine dinucleotide biosynthesis protein A